MPLGVATCTIIHCKISLVILHGDRLISSSSKLLNSVIVPLCQTLLRSTLSSPSSPCTTLAQPCSSIQDFTSLLKLVFWVKSAQGSMKMHQKRETRLLFLVFVLYLICLVSIKPAVGNLVKIISPQCTTQTLLLLSGSSAVLKSWESKRASDTILTAK